MDFDHTLIKVLFVYNEISISILQHSPLVLVWDQQSIRISQTNSLPFEIFPRRRILLSGITLYNIAIPVQYGL